MPKCELKKKRLSLNGENWVKFRRSSYELLILLKAWQFQQSNGFSWFSLDEDLLDKFLPKWKIYLVELIKIKVVRLNPSSEKLNFKNNSSELRPMEISSMKRFKELKTILVQIDSSRYGKLWTGVNSHKR